MCRECKRPYYITTAIAYTSGKPHIGNTYEIVLADAIARYKRFQGYDVRFQTGTDEHGQKIELKAEEAGISPKQFVDGVSTEIRRIWDLMNTSYDKFIRTTDGDHEAQIKRIFKKLYDKGDIYKGHYEGMYCTPCESFFTASQLVDGKCPDCGREVTEAEEEAYFFRMSKYAGQLMKHIEEHPNFIQPESRKNEMVNNFLKPGLQDLCVSRTSFNWGVPVDFDDKHVTYVWLDALSNYITFCGYDPDGAHDEHYKRFWPADVHLIGKDIIRFHTIYWPIFLMALGEPLPKQVFGHPWLLVGDGKMSKSLGNVIYADDLASVFGVDAVRYFILHEMPYNSDGIITWELVCERVNSDLANTLGNLVKRTVSMTNKYFGGKVAPTGVSAEVDGELAAVARSVRDKAAAKLAEYKIADALDEIWTLFRRANKYIDETAPWILARDENNSDRLKQVMYNLSEAIAVGANLIKPFMPSTCAKILGELGVSERAWSDCDKFGLTPEYAVTNAPSTLFERVNFEDIKGKIEEITAKQLAEVAPAHEEESVAQITIDDFAKVRMQVGLVVACEAVKKSKLLHETVKVGDRTLSILSGIAKHYTAEEMVGKKVIVVTNLPPREMKGILSEGMIVCAEAPDGTLSIVSPEKDLPDGSVLS